jgi:hypothetical protein
MMIIDDWFEDRLDERRFNLAFTDDPRDFDMLAGVLRAEAIAYGYSAEALEEVCGGDISTYLVTKQQPRMHDAPIVANIGSGEIDLRPM